MEDNNEVQESSPKVKTTRKKKGSTRGFKPGNALGMVKVPKGYTPRWCDADQANINKKLQEGWVFVNKTTSGSAGHERRDGKEENSTIDGHDLSTVVKYRELVAMMMPDDLVQSRRDYYHNETVRRTKSRVLAKEQINELNGTPYNGAVTGSTITVD